jgi:hypothetical protein
VSVLVTRNRLGNGQKYARYNNTCTRCFIREVVEPKRWVDHKRRRITFLAAIMKKLAGVDQDAAAHRLGNGVPLSTIIEKKQIPASRADNRVGSGGRAWHYAFARVSNHSLVAMHRERGVWSAPADMDENNPIRPYCSRLIGGPQISLTR